MNPLKLMTAAFSICALNAGIVVADSKIQGIVGINHQVIEYSDDDETQDTSIHASYYFTPVDKKSHPWREAAFLERASSVNLLFGRQNHDFSSGSLEGPFYSIFGAYASKSNPLIAALAYFDSEDQGNDALLGDVKREFSTVGIVLGAYLGSSMAVTASYFDGESESTYESALLQDSSISNESYGINVKYVHELPQQQAINMELAASKMEAAGSSEIFDVSGTFYFNPRIGLSAALALWDGDSDFDKGKEFGAGLDAFVTANLSLTFDYEAFEADNNNGEDRDQWSAGVEWWF